MCKYLTPKPISAGTKKLTQQHNWKKHAQGVYSSLCQSFCLFVRAKRGIWSKRVLIRMIGNFLSACIEGILPLFTNFYLHRNFSIFLRNNHDCKTVEALDIFEKQSWLYGYCIEGILCLFTDFHLHRKVSIFFEKQ